VLYRRIAAIDDAEARAVAAFALEHADAIADRAPYRPGDGLRWLAFQAASAQRDALFDALVETPRGGLLTPEEIAELSAFWVHAERIRSGEQAPEDGLGPMGRIREQPWLRRRGHSSALVRRYEVNAYRFLNDLRVAEGRPSTLDELPAFVPPGLTWPRVAAAALVAAVLLAAWLLAATDRRGPAGAPRPESAARAVITGLPDGALVLGAHDGRWWVIEGDGGVGFEATGPLRLPGWVEGGAVGDLTGDGIAELALFSSAPTEADRDERTGVWVFTPDSSSRWRVLARLPAHAGAADPTACAALRGRMAAAEPGGDRVALWRALQRCPQRIAQVSIRDGELHAFQLHYGRQHLRARCDAAGCARFEPVLVVDSDVTSAVHASGRWVLGTGCWSAGRELGYGVVVEDPDGGPPAFLPTGGRTVVVPLDDRRVIAVVGTPCERLSEQPLLAGETRAPALGTHALVVDVSSGRPVELRRVAIGLRALSELWAAPVRRPDGATWLAIVDDDEPARAPGSRNRLRLADARGRLSAEVAMADATEVRGLDLDDDGADEVVAVGTRLGLHLFRVERGDDAPRLIAIDRAGPLRRVSE
jgi:hypothetical protein